MHCKKNRNKLNYINCCTEAQQSFGKEVIWKLGKENEFILTQTEILDILLNRAKAAG